MGLERDGEKKKGVKEEKVEIEKMQSVHGKTIFPATISTYRVYLYFHIYKLCAHA